MNQLKKLFFLALVSIVSMCVLTACGGDDDDSVSQSVVGTWKITELDDEDGYYNYVRFYPNGTYEERELYTTGYYKGELEVERGTYKISGNKLIVKCTYSNSDVIKDQEMELNITFHSSDSFSLSFLGIPSGQYTRVDASEMDTYTPLN